MKICLTDAGKRFQRDWIFRHASIPFTPGHSYAITGPNGSGKSTLLQVIAGMASLSEGRIEYMAGDQLLETGQERAFLSFAAPYMELIEEMSGLEFLHFHAGLRPLLPGHTPIDLLEQAGLSGAATKQIRHYSSGMKQRLRLAQAFFSRSTVLILDEPCTNLDRPGIALYEKWIDSLSGDRLVLVGSNMESEYAFCDEIVQIQQWKRPRPH